MLFVYASFTNFGTITPYPCSPMFYNEGIILKVILVSMR
jgi:hypothetical protein